MSITITNVAVASNVATITTSAAHGIPALFNGLPTAVAIEGLSNTVLNSEFLLTAVPTATTFTFAIVTGDISSVTDSGIVVQYSGMALRTFQLKDATGMTSSARMLVDDPAKVGSEGLSLSILNQAITGPHTGTPGTYTNPTITVDGNLRISAIANGSSSSGSGSTQVLYASENGCVADASATINADPTGWTDNRAAIQTMLNKISGGPIEIVFDGGYYGTTGNTVDTSTHAIKISSLSGCGLIGLPGGGSLVTGDLLLGHGLLSNKHQVAGTGTILDNKGLILEGLYINGGRHRPTGSGWSGGTNGTIAIARSTTGDGVFTHSGTQWCMCLNFYGISNLVIRNCIIRDAPAYSIHVANAQNVRIHDDDIQSSPNENDGLDGIHFNGPVTQFWIHDNRLSIQNDSIALNADDGNNGPVALAFGPNVTRGNITYGRIHNNFIDGSINGIRLLSSSSFIDDVYADGFFGTSHSLFICTTDFGDPYAPDSNSGNFGHWGISNSSVVCSGELGFGGVITGTHTDIKLHDILWTPTESMVSGGILFDGAWLLIGPDFEETESPTAIELLEIDGLHGKDTIGIVCPVVLFGSSGANTVDFVKIRNFTLWQASGSVVDQPVFRMAVGDGGGIDAIEVSSFLCGQIRSVVDLVSGSCPQVYIDGDHRGDKGTPYGSLNTAIDVIDYFLGKSGPKDATGSGTITNMLGSGIGVVAGYGQVGGGGGSSIVSDTFSSADGTNINGKLPNIGVGSDAWSVLIGTMETMSGRLLCTGSIGAFAEWTCVIESGQGDVTVSAKLQINTSGTDSCLVLRATDVNNYWLIQIIDTGAVNIYKKVAGTFSSLLATASLTITDGVDYTVSAQFSGNVLTATVNGSHLITYTDSFNNTATKHGFRFGNTANQADNFLVTHP